MWFFFNLCKWNNLNIKYNKKHGFDKSKKDIYEYQNILLKNENEKLNKMVNYLEKKLLSYEIWVHYLF